MKFYLLFISINRNNFEILSGCPWFTNMGRGFEDSCFQLFRPKLFWLRDDVSISLGFVGSRLLKRGPIGKRKLVGSFWKKSLRKRVVVKISIPISSEKSLIPSLPETRKTVAFRKMVKISRLVVVQKKYRNPESCLPDDKSSKYLEIFISCLLART